MRSALMRRVATVQRIVERVEAEARSARQNEARALVKGLHRLETTLDAKLELVLSGIAETTRHINIRRGDAGASAPLPSSAAAAAAAAASKTKQAALLTGGVRFADAGTRVCWGVSRPGTRVCCPRACAVCA